MDDNFFSYLERLQIMGFFVAYPIVYLFVKSFFSGAKNERISQLPFLLSYAYALVGTLYVGLLIRDLYPFSSVLQNDSSNLFSFLKMWGLLSLIFWIPKIAKQPVFSLLHSLIFFYFLVKDLLFFTIKLRDETVIKNDMRVFTDSLLLNIISLFFIFLIALLYRWVKKTT